MTEQNIGSISASSNKLNTGAFVGETDVLWSPEETDNEPGMIVTVSVHDATIELVEIVQAENVISFSVTVIREDGSEVT